MQLGHEVVIIRDPCNLVRPKLGACTAHAPCLLTHVVDFFFLYEGLEMTMTNGSKQQPKFHRYIIASYIRVIRRIVCGRVLSRRAIDRGTMNRMIQSIAYICLSWTIFYLFWGGTSKGKEWFSNVTSIFFEDYKGGMPFIVLALPILWTSLVATAFWRRTRPGEEERLSIGSNTVPRWLLRFCRGRQMHLRVMAGDASAPQVVSWSFILLLGIYIMGNLSRKLASFGEENFDSVVKDVSNVVGNAALVALCILLLPVTKFSPLVKVFGLSARTALSLHQFTGRFVVVGALTHGTMHAYRWTGIAGEGLFSMLFPPGPCWQGVPDFAPTCQSTSTDCSCYDIFKNLAGAVAGLSLLVIGVSSLAPVRRRMYGLFYRIHMVAGPLVFVATVVHWNRSIVYLAGGILFYLATYAPTVAENLAISRKSAEGVTLVSAERIAAPDRGTSSASFISLTFQAEAHAVARYQPTQYIKMKVPAISSVAHPFSVNKVPNEQQKLRLVIRENGNFTQRLAQQTTSDGVKPPAIFLDGFHGTETRSSEILQHDVVVIIAGGIGITTYLTLIKDTLLLAQSQALPDRRLQKIYLHWICREGHLIDYIRREYFDDMAALMRSVQGIHLAINIHNSGDNLEPTHDRGFTDVETSEDKKQSEEETADILSVGQPFRMSRYSMGSSLSCMENAPISLAFLSTSAVGICGIWYFYSQVQSSDDAFSRFWVLLFLGVLGVVEGVLFNMMLALCCQLLDTPEVEFAPIRGDEEVEMETISEIHHTSISAGGIERAEIRTCSFEEKSGRPSIHSLLNALEESKYPAVFCCGPGRMMSEVREKTLGRCRMRLQRCLCGEPRIALYEEAFEM